MFFQYVGVSVKKTLIFEILNFMQELELLERVFPRTITSRALVINSPGKEAESVSKLFS